jgi:hypothetical protein
MRIEIETWPEPDQAPAAPPAGGPPAVAPAAEGRWRLIQVVLSAHDADTEDVTNGGQRDA